MKDELAAERRSQFNVVLPRELNRLVNIAAAYADMGKGEFVEAALAWYLGEETREIGGEVRNLSEIRRLAVAALSNPSLAIQPVLTKDDHAEVEKANAKRQAVPRRTAH